MTSSIHAREATEPQSQEPIGGQFTPVTAEPTGEFVQALRESQAEKIRALVQEQHGLFRRYVELRLAIGKEVHDLQATYAHPGDGDFVKRVESAGLAIATAYRYVALYRQSLSTDKDSPGATPAQNDEGGSTGAEERAKAGDSEGSSSTNSQPRHRVKKPRRHGYVDPAELTAHREEIQNALPALEVVKLEYAPADMLAFDVYTNYLSAKFETTNTSTIVLRALRQVGAIYGYEEITTQN